MNVIKLVSGIVVRISVVNYVMDIIIYVSFVVMIMVKGLMMEKYFLMFIVVSVNSDEVLNRMYMKLFSW